MKQPENMKYNVGDYLDCGHWVFKILSDEGYSIYGGKYPMYKVERICDRKGFAPHKSIRFPQYSRSFVRNIKALTEPPKVKRNWLWDKKEITIP